MERDVDCSRLHREQLSDLARAEIGAVPERDELAVEVAEGRDRGSDREPQKGLALELVRCRRLPDVARWERPPAQEVVDARAGDSDEPALRPAFPRIEARAVTEGPLDRRARHVLGVRARRSEEHTSELQSLAYLVCRLLLEKKKKKKK